MSFDWSISSAVALVWYATYLVLLVVYLIRNELPQEHNSTSVRDAV
jgi:hypothetical protein